MTTILIKKKDTAGAPAPGDLTNAAGGTEIAVNTATRRIYTKDSGGNVVELGNNATSSTIADLTVTNSTTLSYGTANQVQYLNATKLLVGSSNMTFNGTTLTVNDLTDSSLTSGRVTYAGASGNLVDSANLTFNGTTLTANTLNLTNALGTAYGGTGLTSFTSGGLVYASSSSALATGSVLTYNGASSLTLNAAAAVVTLGAIGSYASVIVAGTNPASIYFNSSTRTGFESHLQYFGANHTFFNETGGSEIMRLLNTGNVGIGTSSPETKLQVSGNAYIGVSTSGGVGAQTGLTVVGGATVSSTDPGIITISSHSNARSVGDDIGRLNFYSNDASGGASGIQASVRAVTSGSVGEFGNLTFFTGSAASLAERMRINSGGSLTLGATEVAGSVGSMTITVGAGGSVSTPLALRNPGTSNGSGVQMSFRGATNSGTEYDYAYIGMLASNTSNGQGTIYFSTSNNGSPSERMRLNNEGQLQVGLNNTGQTGQIQAKGLAASPSTNTYWPITISAGATADTGGYTSMIGLGVESSAWSKGAIGYTRTGSYDTGYIAFYLNSAANSDTVVLADEKARFTKEGNFYVGTTTAYLTEKFNVSSASNQKNALFNNTNASYTELILNLRGSRNTSNGTWGFLQCSRDGIADVLYIYDSGNVVNTNGSYGAISDAKLKENIVDASPKLADLMQVKVRNYNLKYDPTHKQIGVVAQELETVFPSMIDESPDRDAEGKVLGTTTKSVKYSVFVPMLIKAMQEQQAIIESLKARLDAANL